MKIEIFQGEWSLDDVTNSPDKIFIYGDNNARIGKGGQAIIRDLPNTIGLRTKKGPSNKPAAFYTDNEYESNIRNIREDVVLIKSKMLEGKTIVFSNGGYGTGLAKLPETAPKTFNFLYDMLRYHFEFDNLTGRKWQKIPGHDEILSGQYVSLDKNSTHSVLQPVNNSFFQDNLLKKNLMSNYDLIKSGNKTSFTSKTKFKRGEIIIITFSDQPNYIVCRVIDSYDSQISKDLGVWNIFEGYNNDFLNSIDVNGKYQTQFSFICTLDQSGNMFYKDGFFSSDVILDDSISKIAGEKVINNTMKNEEIVEILNNIQIRLDRLENKRFFKNPFRKSLEQLLSDKKIVGDIRKLSDIKNTNVDVSGERYQVKVGNDYYLVVLHKHFFTNSIEIVTVGTKSYI
jgi:hypothetical protein